MAIETPVKREQLAADTTVSDPGLGIANPATLAEERFPGSSYVELAALLRLYTCLGRSIILDCANASLYRVRVP
jgi:hypothetical protein